MTVATLLTIGLALISVSASPAPSDVFAVPEIQAYTPSSTAAPFSFTNNTIIYAPVNNQTLGYPRVTELSDGSILIACTVSGFYPSFFPIFKSADGGVTWNWISNVGVGGNDTIRFPGGKSLKARQGIVTTRTLGL